MQIDANRGDVLSEVSRHQVVSQCLEIFQYLGRQQMHLPEVGLAGIYRDPRAVFDGRPAMGIAFDTEPGEQRECRLLDLAERVRVAAMQSTYRRHHRLMLSRPDLLSCRMGEAIR
jgi:hypothetical protein